MYKLIRSIEEYFKFHGKYPKFIKLSSGNVTDEMLAFLSDWNIKIVDDGDYYDIKVGE